MRRDPIHATASFADDTNGEFREEAMEARLPTYLGVAELEARARDVEHRIKRLDHRPRPTPSESRRTAELKKVRLAVKDRLRDLRERPAPSFRTGTQGSESR